MKTRQLIILSAIFTLLFLIAGWFVTRPFLNFISDYYLSLTSEAKIVASSSTEQIRIHFFSTLALVLLPVLNFFTIFVIKKVKKREISYQLYFVILLIILFGFAIGVALKIWGLGRYVMTLDKPLFPHLLNTFPLSIVKFHNTGLVTAGLAAILAFLFTKKHKISTSSCHEK